MGFSDGIRSFRRNWRAADDPRLALDELLASADPGADPVSQNEWLVELGYWLRRRARIEVPADEPSREPPLVAREIEAESPRGPAVVPSVAPSVAHLSAPSRASFASEPPAPREREASTRLRYLLQVLRRNAALRERVAGTLQSIVRELDAISLLCDTGLPQSPGLWGEVRERFASLVIPATPHTEEWSVLLTLLFPKLNDAEWIEEIDAVAWEHARSLFVSETSKSPRHGMRDVAASIRVLVNQVCAAGLATSLRSRMGFTDFDQSPFLPFVRAAQALLETDAHAAADDPKTLQNVNIFRAYLEACRVAAHRVFEHLDENGVSVDIEFRVEGILARLARIEMLLEFWLQPVEAAAFQRVLANLVRSHQQGRSIRAVFAQSFARLARKVVDRSAETGEHYITRTRAEYRSMFTAAAGGGVITVLTVYLKFAITGGHLHRFIEGLAASLNYAGSFVVIHFAGFTLATKQPAMTAPVLAARLDEVNKPGGMDAFVQETLSLMRSQAAAVLGNVAAVIPVAFLVQWIAGHFFGVNLISVDKARATIASFSLWGPTPLFAAFTGVLLWISAGIAGWADNWFVYRRIQDVLTYHRRLRFVLGEERARRWATFWGEHFSGVVGNVALGFMLGLGPFIAQSVALPLEVRHVTLSSGALAAAVAVLGFSSVTSPGFALAVAGIVAMAFLNVGVSFLLAFQLALRSRDLPRVERSEIYRAIGRAILAKPGSLFVVGRDQQGALSEAS